MARIRIRDLPQDTEMSQQSLRRVLGSGLYINTNVASLVAQKNFGRTQEAMGESFVRLSTGMRINCASDDASGLSLSAMSSRLARMSSVRLSGDE